MRRLAAIPTRFALARVFLDLRQSFRFRERILAPIGIFRLLGKSSEYLVNRKWPLRIGHE